MRADFLIVGSGIAGLRAAVELADAGRVLVLTKAEPREGSTGYAQGGIAAAVGPGDSPDLHAADTLAAADRYAAAFGLLFQVTDDLLDVESTADKAGKRVGKDAARGKLTYPGLLGVEESRRKAAELGRQAVAAADELGSRLLAELARYVVQRDR